ncbi:GGDEF domain-containing protein [Marinobacter daepoensis]|uniref:diguanylate cyclase n=2 Tax=Marinobacter daepoensis TaxID=262077 RepID=A0ABS3BHD6_9GAMM|nr:GGDEF domain-containing protein [Marinobacter daepoensis]MBY6079105.1 GGDEF domain-containing protein [Marinobacter daepoensis]
MGEMIEVVAFSAVVLFMILIGYFMAHLGRKKARLERLQSELAKRMASINVEARTYLQGLKKTFTSVPLPVAILELREQRVLEESELLSNLVQAIAPDRISSPPFTFCFSRADQYPFFMPKLRRALAGGSVDSGIFSDVFSLAQTEINNEPTARVLISVSVSDQLAYVEFEFPDNEKVLEKQASVDNKIIRSMLTETDLPRAFDRAASLIHEPLGGELVCGISVFNSSRNLLELCWQQGFSCQLEDWVSRLPMVFGESPGATATYLGKSITVPAVQSVNRDGVSFSLPSGVHAWHSHPIKSARGKVLGTLDLIALAPGVKFPRDECLANFLFVASVILERRNAMEASVSQARLDQTLNEISQRLLHPGQETGSEVLSQCLTFLNASAELSGGKLGVLSDFGGDQIEYAGELFGNNPATVTDEHDAMILADYAELLGGFHAGGGGAMRPESGMTTLNKGSPKAEKLGQALPLVPEMKQVNFLVCPMALPNAKVSALIYATESDFSPAQQTLLSTVVPVLTNFLIREHLLEKLQSRANYDRLTGALSRGHTEEKLGSEIERSTRYKNELSVVLFDIDHFKSINDSFGHDVGDAVLKRVASKVQASLRSVDVLGRWGGEEFLMILAETDLKNAQHVAENVRRLIELEGFGLPRPVTISAGVSSFQQGDDSVSLIKRADIAVYEAKREGRNRVKAAPAPTSFPTS